MNEREKPAIIAAHDFSIALLNLINNCDLPPFVIKDTLRCALIQVENLADKQYEQALQEYNASLNNEEVVLE